MSIDPQEEPGDGGSSLIERKLSELYRSPAPDDQFAARLEAQLSDRKLRSSPPSRWRSAWNWALGAAGFVLLIIFIIAAFSFLPRPPNAMPQVEPAESAVLASTMTVTPTSNLLAGEILPAVTAGPLRYKVAAGDTCAVIAYSFGISVESIINLNRLDPACTDLTDGQELLIPQPTASAQFTPAPTPLPITYTIAAGDTIYSIAQRFGVSAASIFELNSIQSGDILLPGRELLVPILVVPTLEPGAAPYVLSRMGSEKVNLRSGPGTEYPVVGAFGENERLTISASQPRGEWIPVDYPGAPGGIAWVWSQIVMVVDAGGQVAAASPSVQVSASNPRREEETLLVDVCFTLLDSRDWMVQDALVSADSAGETIQAPIIASSLISLNPVGEDGTSGERCDVLEFSLLLGNSAVTPTLQVLALEAPPREGETCNTYLEQVQSALDRKTSGIRVACEEAPQSFGSWKIAAKPESLSQEDAEAILYQAFRETITIEGPWNFDLVAIGGENGIPYLETQAPLVAELRLLKKLRSAAFIPKPGWLHLLSREIYAEPGAAPDGTELPAEHLTDEWFYFDEAGVLQRSVTRVLDQNDAVLFTQVSGEDEAGEARDEPPAFDYGFYDLAVSAAKRGVELNRESVTVDGEYKGEKYVLEEDQVRWEAMYAEDTGQLISMLTWEILPEGAKLARSVVLLEIEAVSELPSGVAVLLTPVP